MRDCLGLRRRRGCRRPRPHRRRCCCWRVPRLQLGAQLWGRLLQLALNPVEQRRQRAACRHAGRQRGRSRGLLLSAGGVLGDSDRAVHVRGQMGRGPAEQACMQRPANEPHASPRGPQVLHENKPARLPASRPPLPYPLHTHPPFGRRQAGSRSSSKNGCCMASRAAERCVGLYTSSLLTCRQAVRWGGGGGNEVRWEGEGLGQTVPLPAGQPAGRQQHTQQQLRPGSKTQRAPLQPASQQPAHPPGRLHLLACALRRPWPKGAP
jgi:hypothetical protein